MKDTSYSEGKVNESITRNKLWLKICYRNTFFLHLVFKAMYKNRFRSDKQLSVEIEMLRYDGFEEPQVWVVTT